MRHALTVLVLIAVPSLGRADRFQKDGAGLVLRNGQEYIRFEGGGWSAGIEGGRSIRWHVCLWHDNWVYETMAGDRIEDGPSETPDGGFSLRGSFSAREGSAPVHYVQTVVPTDDGVHVKCELAKSGPLRLTDGVWLRIFADRDAFTGDERIWGWPSWHGPISAAAGGAAGKLLVELAGGRAVCFAPDRFRQAQNEASGTSYALRLNLLPGDFDVSERAALEYTVSFQDMPERLPGEVSPMREKLEIRGVTPNAKSVGLYDKLELTVDLGATYDNPYDPDDVALDAAVTSPSGKQVHLPGFFLVEQRREVHDESEVMIPEGNGGWKVRFAPTEVGRYTYRLTLRDRTGDVSGGEGAFTAKRGKQKGFLRPSRVDPHYFAFDNGDGYLAIGHNLPIYHTSGQLGDEGMRRFAAAKENYNRWWMCSYGFGIEWMKDLGWYRQDAAARIDLALDVAKDLGLYYMMCMDTHQDFRENGWERNPFNAKNGGPCASPREWFTNEAARGFYKKRLRYTVARWGYSPNVLCWEFGNEFEGWANSPDEVKLPWHREMSDYLRSIDPFGHMITTSFWSSTGPEEYWRLPNIDIVQTHCYTNDDNNVAQAIRQYSLHQWRTFEKPHIFGEFGIRSHSTTADKDPQGWGVHNALWAGLSNFCAGLPMPWWHETYIDRLDLYFHFTAVQRFAADLPFGTATWEPLDTTDVAFADPNHKPETRDAQVTPLSRWGKPEYNEFVLLPDGTIEGERRPQELLQGQGHQDLKNPPTFIVDYPQDGQFIVHVGTVSNSGLLRIWIDDDLKLEKDLPCGEGLGKQSAWREQWTLWETTYDEDVTVPVPVGRHRIRIENFGKDWVRVASYKFTGCNVLDKPNLLACAMRTKDLAILWLQNRDSSWYNHAGTGPVGKVDPSMLTLTGLPNGQYRVEWWETWKGQRERAETVTVRGGRLRLDIPAIETDVALKLKHM